MRDVGAETGFGDDDGVRTGDDGRERVAPRFVGSGFADFVRLGLSDFDGGARNGRGAGIRDAADYGPVKDLRAECGGQKLEERGSINQKRKQLTECECVVLVHGTTSRKRWFSKRINVNA